MDGIFTNHPDVLRAIVDRRTGHAPRPAVDRVPGCPGVAGTVTAASTHAPVPSGSDRLSAAEGHTVEESSVDWGSIAVALGALVVVAGAIVWALARRRPR